MKLREATALVGLALGIGSCSQATINAKKQRPDTTIQVKEKTDPGIRVVRRNTEYCSSNLTEIQEMINRECVDQVKKFKREGIHCVSCEVEREVSN